MIALEPGEPLDRFIDLIQGDVLVEQLVLLVDQILCTHPQEIDPVTGVREPWEHLAELVEKYPRPGLRRVFLEEEGGTVVVQRLTSGQSLLVIANGASSLGAVSMGVGKLAGSLQNGGGA